MPTSPNDDHMDQVALEAPYRKRITEITEHTPCAAYVVKDDIDFTFVGGNKLFFQLIGCTEDTLGQKFGYRLGALLDEGSLHATGKLVRSLTDGESGFIHQHLKKGDKSTWIHTRFTRHTSEIGNVLYCASLDITDLTTSLNYSREKARRLEFATKQAQLGAFEYNPENGEALVFGSSTLIPPDLSDEQGVCHHFIERVIEKGIICAEYLEAFRDALCPKQTVDGAYSSCELRMKTNDGNLVWSRLTVSPLPDDNQKSPRVIGTVEDVTQQKEAALEYMHTAQFFQSLLTDNDAYGQVDITENRIMRVGGMWNLYNELINDVSYSDLFDAFIDKVVHPDDRKHYKEFMRCSNFIESLDNGIDKLGCEFRRIVDQNKMMWMQMSTHLFRDPLSGHVFGLLYLKNIDSRKKQELALSQGSPLDYLTNVLNKKATQTAIVEYLENVMPTDSYALIIADLDDFRIINEQYGHEAGDKVIIKLASILGSAFRKNDIVGRFGGDVFIILMKDVSSREWVSKRLDQVLRMLSNETEVEFLSCSVGIAYTTGAATYESLFRYADIALYEAKSDGKGCYRFFDESSSALIDRRDRVENGLRAHDEARNERCEPSANLYGRGNLRSFDFANLISEQGDMAYLVDIDTYSLLCGNTAFYDRLGLTEEQCLGKKCYEVMHHREAPCPFCGKANWSSDKFYLWKNPNTILEQEFLIKNKLVNWNGNETLLAIAVDLSNDKSIVDSLDNGATESHAVLTGVQHLISASTLEEAMRFSLEAIGSFFGADTVRFWQRPSEKDSYHCTYQWEKQPSTMEPAYEKEVNNWIESVAWDRPINLESPEAMMCHSYDMYQHMTNNNIRNQRWLRLRNEAGNLGYLSIEDISSNFQNVAFLESFSVFIATEFTRRSFVEKTLHNAHYDELTDLLCRRSFEEFMRSYDSESVSCIGVVVANFDNLKKINETRGLETGNIFIRQFADLFRESLGECALYRLNGDELLAIALDTKQSHLNRATKNLEKAIKENGSFTASIGCAWDEIENDLPLLIQQATQAMQTNKKKHHDSSNDHEDTAHRQMLSELMSCIDGGDYKVFLQPKVNLESKAVIGAEALIRFQDETGGIVAPGKFIDILERNDLIRYIDLFVLEDVCRMLEDWKRRAMPLPIISLNFSRFTLLERDIVSSVEAIVGRYDVSKNNLEIEITESAVVIGKSILYQAARDLYQAGYSISLDDFGTKYTNLSILADIDFNVLKIDRSLVNALGVQANYRTILGNVISMCDDLNIEVIAEGVETLEQESILRSLNCRFGQGYLYGKPMPISKFEECCLIPEEHE